MSRWATFYYDLISDHVSALKVHNNKEDALKYFNKHCKSYFQLTTPFKADKLPASYGYPHRKYCCISTIAFKKEFGVSLDEALKIAGGAE